MRARGAAEGASKMASGPTELQELDEIDRKIIELLTRNGRTTNQQIARKLNLAAATVSARIRRLEEADAMRVVAVSDFAAFGLNALMAVGVEVEGRPAEDVAADLAALPEVFSAHLVTGRYDIELLVALRSMDDLPDFLLAKVSRIAGIRSLDPSIAVDVIRYEFDVAPMASRGA